MSRLSALMSVVSRGIPRESKERIKARIGVPSVGTSLEILRDNGFAPGAAVDVGAFEGEWTRLCKGIWPQCQVLMVEPLASKCAALTATMRESSGVQVVPALVGAEARSSVPFYECETASSVLAEPDRPAVPSLHLEMTTLDTVIATHEFPSPDLVKVDVQGYELEVLRGGEKSLAGAEVVLLEVNLLQIYDGAPPASEVVAFMAAHGFQLYDICTLMRRPYDRALWQLDALFVRSTSRLLASRKWI